MQPQDPASAPNNQPSNGQQPQWQSPPPQPQPPQQPQQPAAQQQPAVPQPQAADGTTQPMYWSRPYDPQAPQISPEIQQKYEESRRKYPKLNLSNGEYVISDVKRHPIGLIGIWGAATAVVMIVLAMLAMLVQNDSTGLSSQVPASLVGLGVLVVAVLVACGATALAWIYQANKFYLTNESVIQNIQNSLFSKRQQTVSLANIEDASHLRSGIMQHIFNYGSIRLSTEGDETTYRFSFAARPEEQVRVLNNAVEAFKNGRPIEH